MARRLRIAAAGFAYHVLNREAGRKTLFHKQHDYQAFEKVIGQAFDRLPVRILSYCLMSNHWHLVLWPSHDGDLSQFVRWLTVTHTQRHHAHYQATGTGPLYQGRFKSFPIQEDGHLLTVCRYVERNPLRANVVRRAEDWEWSSLAARMRHKPPGWLLPSSQWPAPMPGDWVKWTNQAQTAAEEAALHDSVTRGRPFGDEKWTEITVGRLKLESSMRPRHRPKAIKDS